MLARWQGSDHDRAMQVATAETVLGDFSEREAQHFGVTTNFSQKGGKFVVNTDGPDGALRDYEVAYTFGVDPLQQYLVRFPDGRVQALPYAWDTRPKEQGGQDWFHLYPDEALPPDDVLHWTGIQQNWNHMCASCHSTNLRKGYRAGEDRFETTWSEIDVSCEACHGPGSRHATSARSSGGVVPMADLRGSRQIETCARCHARASLLAEDPFAAATLADTHRVALLDEELYFADGQIQDEVFVYGSFLQSRKYAAGVRCSDCHDPHSLSIEGPLDDTCSGCHAAEVFQSRTHHHHEPGSVGSSCVACHMPTRTYMRIDDRRDHSFSVPRPGLTAAIGTPNACSGCHADRTAVWLADRVSEWRGSAPVRAHFAEALHAGRTRSAEATKALAALAVDPEQPAIARATALRLLRGSASPEVLASGLREGDALVRMAAVEAAEGAEPTARRDLVAPLLRDPVRSIRLEAERVLRGLPPHLWRPADRSALAAVQSEQVSLQRLHADRPESWVNLGLLQATQGNAEDARASYERALRIESHFVPAAVNLSDLHRALGSDHEGERILRRALEQVPSSAAAHHALGLTLVRLGRRDEAIVELARASELAPDQPRYAYVHAVALHSSGDVTAARGVLEDLLRRHPNDALAQAFLAKLGTR